MNASSRLSLQPVCQSYITCKTISYSRTWAEYIYIYAIENNYFCSSRWIWSTTYVIDRFAAFSSCKYSLLAFIRWPSPRKRIFSHTLTDHKLTINQNSHFSIKCETQCVYMMINSMSGQVMQDATYVCFFITPMHASPSAFLIFIFFLRDVKMPLIILKTFNFFSFFS